jgi:cytidylate kinase
MKQIIITIGREYGSEGSTVAQKVAEHYNIPFYHKRLLAEVAKDGKYSEEILEKFDERPVNLLFTPMPLAGAESVSIERSVAVSQFQFLLKKANEEKESFVVVGRCAEEILASNPNVVSIFILADTETKLKTLMERDGISEKEAYNRMKKADKIRKTYHNFYCEKKWGDSRSYDLCINVSKGGLEEAANLIIKYVDDILK